MSKVRLKGSALRQGQDARGYDCAKRQDGESPVLQPFIWRSIGDSCHYGRLPRGTALQGGVV